MKRTSRVLAGILSLALTSSSVVTIAAPAQTRLTERQRALHVLNRLGFGPRPGDVDRVVAMGIDRWVERQLQPEKIDDRAVETKLASLKTLSMPQRQILTEIAAPILEAQRNQRQQQNANTAKVDENEAGVMEDLATNGRPRVSPGMRAQRRKARQLVEELSVARVLRAAESERQLDEVMTDFWMNHFNVFAGKGIDRYLMTSYERDTVHPRIWGQFEDLLMATAKSPAMLFYLDNARSVAEAKNRQASFSSGAGGFGRRGTMAGGGFAGRPGLPQGQQARNAGINENYARELLELHTLGVDGGYTQKDVTELARVLTGWSIGRPEQGGGFIFRAEVHDRAPKTVLGSSFGSGGGIEEGEAMIRFLARHPSTARHIATRLCQRLVSDEPPAVLVDRVAKRFLETKGNLRETVRAIVTSPEFFSSKSYRAKIKTPFEYVVSAVRALDANTDGRMLVIQLREMGQPLYLCQPPTGYSDLSEPWVNSGALLARMNFALSLAGNNVFGTTSRIKRLPESAEKGDEVIARYARSMLGDDLSAGTVKIINDRLEKSGEMGVDEKSRLVAGLVIGSPEFQRQ